MRCYKYVAALVLSFALCCPFCFATGSDLDTLGAVDIGVPELVDDVGVITYSVLSPVTPSNTNGLVSVVLSLIGDYNPIVAEHRYQNINGTYSYVREIQPDYPWLVSVALFALVLYCVFRMWGGIFCRI